jgi:hypothetical protein
MPTVEELMRRVMPQSAVDQRLHEGGYIKVAEQFGASHFPKNPQATTAIAFALRYGQSFGYKLVPDTFVLLGIISEATNIPASLFRDRHIKFPLVLEAFKRCFMFDDDSIEICSANAADSLINLYQVAIDIAKEYGAPCIGTEHLFCALVLLNNPEFANISRQLELNPLEISDEILQLLYPDAEFRRQNAKQIAETAKANQFLSMNERGTVMLSQVVGHIDFDLEIPNEIIACLYGVRKDNKVSLEDFKHMLEFFTKNQKK